MVDKKANKWADEVLLSRVENTTNRKLHQAGSPNEEELQLYRKLYKETNAGSRKKRALVLGMTPGLRHTLQQDECEVVCVDISEYAIERFRDWLPQSEQEQEIIIQGNWLNVENLLDEKVNIIVGDGVFANLLTLQENLDLLRKLKEIMTPDGVMVFRNIVRPNDFYLDEFSINNRLELFRQGKLSEPEFGFDFRIWAFYEKAYDRDSHCLNSKIVFEECDELLDKGVISESEYQITRRYYFDGKSYIPPQNVWENTLEKSGVQFRAEKLLGKSWYEYYFLYSCFLA